MTDDEQLADLPCDVCGKEMSDHGDGGTEQPADQPAAEPPPKWQVLQMDGRYDSVYSSAPNTHYEVSPTSAPFLRDYLNDLESRLAEAEQRAAIKELALQQAFNRERGGEEELQHYLRRNKAILEDLAARDALIQELREGLERIGGFIVVQPRKSETLRVVESITSALLARIDAEVPK